MEKHKLRIINEVKKRPILWVEKLPSNYKTNEKCDKEWEEIGKLIGVDAAKVKKTWRNLRYIYLCEGEKIRQRILKAKLNGYFDPYRKYYTWTYYDDLQFIAYGLKSAKKSEECSSTYLVQSKNGEYSDNDIEVITKKKSNIKAKPKCKKKVVNKLPVLLNNQLPFKGIVPVEVLEPNDPLEYIDEIPSSDIEIEIEDSDESSLDIHESMQDEAIDNEDISHLTYMDIKEEPQDQDFSEHMFKTENELISQSSSIYNSLTGTALDETVGNAESSQCALISLNQENKSTDKYNTLKKEDLQIKMESEENFAWGNKHCPEQISEPPIVIKSEVCAQNEQVSQSSSIKDPLTGTNLNETVGNGDSSLCALISLNQENKSADKDNILQKEDVQIKMEIEENFVWENKHYSEETLSSNSKDLFIPTERNEEKTLSDSTNGKRNNNNKITKDQQSKENNKSRNNANKRSYLADDKRSYYDTIYTGDPDYTFLLNCLPPMAIMKKSESTNFRAKVAELVCKIFSSSLPVVNETILPI